MLSNGTRLGVYEVIAPIGSGGMGEVYRARDTRLGRDVAIKTIPPGLGHDPERLGRFEREAQLLAALNHPHIAAIYGIETSGGTQFLVLELVEGETLAARIAAGRIPVDEALRLSREIIDALETAHDKGIIHRDLKPSNIALTADGHVKVLDFGLAKATEAAIAGSSEASPIGVTYSPTLSLAATQAGVILGTAAYMSPEQAKGRVADRRSDVWAFGCVLFEMLTGTRPFEGEDVSDTMAAVLRGDPPWEKLPAELPPYLRTLLQRCLAKDRRVRIPDFSVVRFMLDEGPAAAAAQRAAVPVPAPAASRVGRLLPWGVASAALVAALALLVIWKPWRTAAAPSPVRVNIDIGFDDSLFTDSGSATALSPDGRAAVFAIGGSITPPRLVLRRFDQLEATPLANTEGAVQPFFSPDGLWIGFFAGGKVKKIAVTGGAAVTLADAAQPRGGTWTDDGYIIFAPSSAAGLSRVSEAGGPVEPWTQFTSGTHRWPDALPGGRVLFTMSTGQSFEGAELGVRDPDGKVRSILKGGMYGRYASTGHIVYVVNGALFAAPFDAARGDVTGPGVPVIDAVVTSPGNAAAQIALSKTGLAAYLPGGTVTNEAPIHWLDAGGKTEVLRAMPSNWSNPSFSPDGKRLAIDISDGTQSDIWIYDWSRDALSRLTFDPTDDIRPVWSPDGSRIAYSSRRGDKQVANLWWQRSDGTGEAQRLTESPNQQMIASFHPDGRTLSFDDVNVQAKTSRDILMLSLEGSEASGWKPGKVTTFLQTPQSEASAMFSPDGHWLAYISNETGRNEVYVRPYPGPGGKWQISTSGGDDPTWSPLGKAFFFATNDAKLWMASYRVNGTSFEADKPQPWSTVAFLARPRTPSRDLAIHPDGKRFALAAANTGADQKVKQIVLVFNVGEELRRAAAAR